ncbi:hypothetical protein Tco_1498952 [Tanacetum coccineum]
MTHPHPNRRFVPQAILTRSGKINTAGASVNTIVRPVNTAGSKPTMNHPRPISNAYKKGYSQVTKQFNKYSTNKNSIFNKKVNIVRVKDTTTRDRAVGNPQQKEYREKGVFDSGCSRHMTGNKCYLTEYEDYDSGFVSFGDGKDRISVLSSDFKLLDESQVLLRVPRKDNIYSVDLKSVVPTKGLTCLFVKATIEESKAKHIEHLVLDTKPLKHYDYHQSVGPTYKVKVGDEAVHKELGDRMEKAVTTASCLEVEQDSGNINRTQSMAILNEPSP